MYQKMAEEIRNGKIGKVLTARAYRISNMFPSGIGNMKPENPPKGLDWDLWLGPRPFRPYQYNIAPYSFRWWKLYSSQMGNWGGFGVFTYLLFTENVNVDDILFSNAISSTDVNMTDGNFTLSFLGEGNYTLITALYTGIAFQNVVDTEDNVEVFKGQATFVDMNTSD